MSLKRLLSVSVGLPVGVYLITCAVLIVAFFYLRPLNQMSYDALWLLRHASQLTTVINEFSLPHSHARAIRQSATLTTEISDLLARRATEGRSEEALSAIESHFQLCKANVVRYQQALKVNTESSLAGMQVAKLQGLTLATCGAFQESVIGFNFQLERQFIRSVEVVAWVIILVFSFGLLSTLISSAFFARVFGVTLKLLRDGIASIKADSVAPPFKQLPANELGDLGKQINYMVQKLLDADNKVRHYAHALEIKNRDLEEFAYVAAHDLKSPLRAGFQLVDWINEALEDQDTILARQHLSLLEKRLKRLDCLLDGLREYSKVHILNSPIQKVDLAALLNNVFNLVAKPGFTLENQLVGKVIHTHPQPLARLFSLLIENAIKHHDKSSGCIKVSMSEESGDYRFKVEDDGPGIDPRYIHKACELFQTLKPKDQVEGSGLGLSLATKILAVYHGELFIDADEKRGTKIMFTWPNEKTLSALM